MFTLSPHHISMENNNKTINEKEVETLAFWKENKIFEKSVEMPAGATPQGVFSFYDGPPFATGMPHMGHILAGTIKDAIPRYHSMCGKSVRRVWGWDCHGLPIENLIEKKLNLASKKDIESYGVGKFNQEAYDSVLAYDGEWKKIIPRLGRWVDMEHPYKTMDATYTESVWWSWKTLYDKGLAYEGHKIMHICPRCETPLAQSEVGLEYHDVTDISVTAKFELVDEPGTFVLAWTTTPWTLPGNTALAVHKDIEYVKVKVLPMFSKIEVGEAVPKFNPYFAYLAKKCLIKDESVTTEDLYMYGGQFLKIIEEFKGEKLIGLKYKPPFNYFQDDLKNGKIVNGENAYKIWHADFITDDAGTGIAHEAPAFGADDMELAKANKIPVIKHVNMDGTFTSDVLDFVGVKVKQKDDTQSADIKIIQWLAHHGKLFEKHKIIHSYPLCWRCKTPLLNYATSSWFVDVPVIKDTLIAENKNIGWTPEHVREGRFGKWLEGAREWAVSRTRYWGAPLPVWKSKSGKVKVIGSLAELAELNANKSKNKYFVMRHGESDNNIQGKYDSSDYVENRLTEKGREQIETSSFGLENKNIDIIVSSPFVRTKETAELVAQKIGIKKESIIFDDRLKEYYLGDLDGKVIDKINHMPVWKNHTEDLDGVMMGVESFKSLIQRSSSFIKSIEEKYEGKNILIVTHLAPAKALKYVAELATDEKIIEEGKDHIHSPAYFKNAEIKQFDYAMVPRDETGSINLHRPYIDEVKLEIDGEEYTRIPDVFDCWYESGSMPYAQLHYPFENKDIFEKNFPADFIAEGLDQTRGWFYSLINLGVGLFDKAPYKHVIVNGLVMSESGIKLSKSEKNYTDPMELVEKYGADAVRYTLLSSPVVRAENIQFADKDVESVYKKNISRLENTIALYVMNKSHVFGDIQTLEARKNVLDIWLISRLNECIAQATKGYESYVLDEATKWLDLFVDDISVWYVRRSRDRFKGDTGGIDKRECEETFVYVLQTLAKIIAPAMPFLAERVYKEMGGEKESVHLCAWPKEGDIDVQTISTMKEVRNSISLGLMKRSEAKIGVRQPLASVTFSKKVDEMYICHVLDELNVKEIHVDDSMEGVVLDTVLTEALTREGEMRNVIRAIQDKRKEMNLSPKDEIILIASRVLPFPSDEIQKVCNIKEIIIDENSIDFAVFVGESELHMGIKRVY